MKFEKYKNVIETYMTWEEAKEYCTKLGDGWRLPTKDELIYMFNTTENEFGNYGCWGERHSLFYYWSLGFKTGNVYLNLNENKNYLIPVRDV